EQAVIRAAYAFQSQGLGKAVLVGREDLVHENMIAAGVDPKEAGIEVLNARLSTWNEAAVDYLYKRLQREGFLRRDVQRLINQDRNAFAACMVALGHADGMVTGVTRNFDTAYDDVRKVLDARPRRRVIGVSIALCR